MHVGAECAAWEQATCLEMEVSPLGIMAIVGSKCDVQHGTHNRGAESEQVIERLQTLYYIHMVDT